MHCNKSSAGDACVRACICVRASAFIFTKYGFMRLFSPSLSLGGYQQPNVYVRVRVVGEKRRRKKRSCVWPKTATESRVV